MTFKAFLSLLLAVLTIASHVVPRASPPPQIPTLARRGIAFNDPKFIRMFSVDDTFATWTYNWDSVQPDYESWFVFVPLLYSLRPAHTDVWRTRTERAVKEANNGKRPIWFMGFHEPDNCQAGAGGSCIRVTDAVAGWKKHMDPLKDLKSDLYLVSPAVSNAPAVDNMGLRWLKKFLGTCSGCTIDVVAIHWYGRSKDVDGFKKHVEDVRSIIQGRPIWVSEFRASGSDNEIKAFLHETMTWMDAQDDIHRYAYFMARPGPGMLINDAQDGLSDLGKFYTTDYGEPS